MRRLLPLTLVVLVLAGCNTGTTLLVDSNGNGPTFGFELNEPPESDPCEVGWRPVEIDVDLAGPPPTTTEVVGLDVPKLVFQEEENFGDWYQLDIGLYTGAGADNIGTIDGSGHWVQSLTVAAQLYDVGDPLDCEKDDLVCDLVGLLTLEGDHPDGPLSGSGALYVVGECDAPFYGLLDFASLTVTDLELG